LKGIDILILLNYNYNFVNDYFVNEKAISNFDNKQIIEMEMPSEKLLLNNKYLNYYEYQKDGVITTGPFIIVNKNDKKSIVLLTNNLCNEFKKHIENVVSTKDLAIDVDYDSAKYCIENGDYNNYKVTANSKEKSVPYSSYNNIWDMWTNKKTTKYTNVPGYTYNVQSTTHWNVDGIGFCEGTNKYLENLNIQNLNKSQKINLCKINNNVNSITKMNNQSGYTR
jgi:hypothetical protein